MVLHREGGRRVARRGNTGVYRVFHVYGIKLSSSIRLNKRKNVTIICSVLFRQRNSREKVRDTVIAGYKTGEI